MIASKEPEDDVTSQPAEGLEGLIAQIRTAQAAQQDARAIDQMVTKETGTTEELRLLVRHDSILDLIFLCIDRTKILRARAAAWAPRAPREKPLHEMVTAWVAENRDARFEDLWAHLRSQKGGKVVEGIDDEFLEIKGREKAYKFTGVRAIYQGARKKLGFTGR
jgi:hypothetical protein